MYSFWKHYLSIEFYRNVIIVFILLLNSGCFLNLNVTNLEKDKSQSSTENSVASLANPENVQIDNILSKQVSANWSAVLSATKYRIQISDAAIPAEYCTGNYISSSSVSLDLDTLASNTTYYYRICADDGTITSSGVTGSFKTLKYAQRNPAFSSYKNWNDYLVNDGNKFHDATQTVCPGGSTGGHNSCINGGLVQKMVLPELVTCNRVGVRDSLGVFSWSCDDSNATTILYSTDLIGSKGLMDLIQGYAFKKNSVVVKVDNVDTYSSDSETWWDNPIEELPDSPFGSAISLTNSGSTAGKIFVLSSSKNADKYIVDENKVSVVILKNNVLKKFSASAQVYFLNFNSRLYNWLEGYIDGNSLNSSIILANSSFMRIHNANIYNFTSTGISAGVGYNNIISNFKILNGHTAINNTATGTLIRDGVISGMTSYHLQNINGSFVKNMVLANNSNPSWTVIAYPNESIFSNITIANNSTSYGMRLFGSYHNLFHNFLISNSGSTAIYSWQGAHNTFSQLLTVGSSTAEIQISTTQNEANKFTNNLVIEDLAECSATNDTAFSSGLTPGTCLSHGPYSDVSLRVVPLDQSKFFAGKVTSTDSINLNNSLGTSLFSVISDWFRFENPFRVWGVDGSAFPNSDNKGGCTAGTCRIWDYRLLNDSGNMAFNNTHNVLTKNDPFVAGAVCPLAVAGSVYTTYTNTNTATTYTFLTNAVEIIGDGIGNDNVLCESGESCLYTPNFGSYQGEGDYLKQGTCDFQNGTISNVKLYAYPTNGI